MVLEGLDPFDPQNLGVPNLANPTSINLSSGPVDVRDMTGKDVKAFRSTKELYHAYGVVEMMMQRISEFHTSKCNPDDRDTLHTLHDTAKTSLSAAENMGTMSTGGRDAMSSRRMSPSMSSPHSSYSSSPSRHSGPSYSRSRHRSRSPRSPSTSSGGGGGARMRRF